MQRMLARGPGQSLGAQQAQPSNAPIVLAHEPSFRIGEAEFRPATREVVFGGDAAVIEPRVMQVLVALHRAGGAVVSKDDLQASCWENRVVGEDAINRVVSRLRAVAEKQARGQFRVETITKVGYRLVPSGSDLPSSPDAPLRTHTDRRGLLVAGSALGAVAVAGVGWRFVRPASVPREAEVLYADARTGLFEGTPDEVSNSIARLKQASQMAPDSARIWGLLAFAYLMEADLAPLGRWADPRARGLAATDRALSLDPDQGDALAARVKAVPLFRNWLGREAASRAALERQPGHDLLNILLADVLASVGRSAEALDRLDIAARRAPDFAHLYFKRVYLLWSLGRLDEAEAVIARGVTLWPRHYAVWFARIYFLMFNGRAAEAAALIHDEATRPLGIPDWNYDAVEDQANAIASGDPARIREAVESSAKLAKRGTGFTETAAVFASYAGDLDTAYRMAGALFFDRGFAMPDMYFSKEQASFGRRRNTYWLFERPVMPFRRDPRFAALTRDLGLDEYWRRTNSRSLVVA